MNHTVEQVLERLEGVRASGDQSWMAKCPAHKDDKPSLSITRGKSGNLLMKCFAGCTFADIALAIGIEEKDLFADPPKEKRRPGAQEVAPTVETLAARTMVPADALRSYGLQNIVGGVAVPYMGEHGRPLYSKKRLSIDGKGEKPKYVMPKGQKGTVYGLDRLQGFRESARAGLVIVEGESDCWVSWYANIPAIGLPGATTQDVLQAEHVSGFKTIFVVEENDAAGTAFANAVCSRIRAQFGTHAKLQIVQMKSLGLKDPGELFIACKGDAQEFASRFRALCLSSVSYESGQIEGMFESMSSVEPERPDFLWRPYFVRGAVNLLAGKPGAGKSFVTCELVALATSPAKKPPGWNDALPEQGRVLMIFAEDSPGTVRVRLEACGAQVELVDMVKTEHLSGFTLDERGAGMIQAYVQSRNPTLVVIDPVANFLDSGVNMNQQNEVYGALKYLVRLATATGVTIIIVAHQKKGQSDLAAESVIGSQGFQSAVRSVVIVSSDPEDERTSLFAHAKHNLSGRGDTWKFRVTEEIDPRIEWLGRDERTANEVTSHTVSDHDARAELASAKEVLRAALSRGPQPAEELISSLRRQGISPSIAKKAFYALDGRSRGVLQMSGAIETEWTLPYPKGETIDPSKPHAVEGGAEGLNDEMPI